MSNRILSDPIKPDSFFDRIRRGLTVGSVDLGCNRGRYPLMNTVVNLIRAGIIVPIAISTVPTTFQTSTKEQHVCSGVKSTDSIIDENDSRYYYISVKSSELEIWSLQIWSFSAKF